MKPILEVSDLCITLKQKKKKIDAVDHISFSLEKGKTLGIIGESGSGKSLTCMGILGLLKKELWDVQGEIRFQDEVLNMKDRKQITKLNGNKIAMIMQNPMSAFNPVITIGAHFYETMNKPGKEKLSKNEIQRIAIGLLEKMHIRDSESVLRSYAFQLSGGMLQRIMIALALAVKPDILIADEPTTALDLSVQSEIIHILKELQKEYGMSILIVSHDLSVIRALSHNIAVMYAGNFVEKGTVEELLEKPAHPYTRGLFASKPEFSKKRLPMMEGQPPSLEERHEGCRFYERCPEKTEKCLQYKIRSQMETKGHQVNCVRCYEEKKV